MFVGKRVQRYTFSVNWQNVFVFFFEKGAFLGVCLIRVKAKGQQSGGNPAGKPQGTLKGRRALGRECGGAQDIIYK